MLKVSQKTKIKVNHQTNQKNLQNLKDFYEKNNIENEVFSYKPDFFNLIKNSIESIQQRAENDSNLEKKITIEVNEENNHIIINLIDNGIGFGIFAANIKDILNPYFTTKKNGTGLGLSIVSKIINDHNGKIEFIPLDEGAKIKIDFVK